MPSHEVVVLRTNPAPGETRWSVAVCFEHPCLWRGRVWSSAQTAVDEANRHRYETKDAPDTREYPAATRE
jgi:hypothetical protein